MITQGAIWWANFGDPIGSEPGFRRPMLVVQNDHYNRSRIGTVVCVPVTSNARWSEIRDNIHLSTRDTGLHHDSVALVAQITTIDRSQLIEPIGHLSDRKLEQVLTSVCAVVGR